MSEMQFVKWSQLLKLTTQCVEDLLRDRIRVPDPVRIFGVPRGGCVPAVLVAAELNMRGFRIRLVDSAGDADLVVDDLIDSGETKRRYENENRRFIALIDKSEPEWAGKWIVFPWEQNGEEQPTDAIVRILSYIGEDPNREGLRDTPKRVIKSYGELFAGYGKDAADLMTVFEDGACDEMVVLRSISMQSFCEHHMLPFIGVAHVAYVPNNRVIGVSKLARLVDMFAKRLQIQERICQQVTAALDEHLQPHGSACVIEAKHLCMSCRGVNKQNSSMITSSLTGVFRENAVTRSEFLSLIQRS